MTDVSAYIRSKLAEVLPRDAAARAISRLETTNFPLAKSGSELETRIRLGILKCVCDPWHSIYVEPSTIDKFEDALQLAKTDWRDLLVSAGLENDDWRSVLIRSGYETPSLEESPASRNPILRLWPMLKRRLTR